MTLVTDEDLWEVASSIPLGVTMANLVMIGTNYRGGSSSFRHPLFVNEHLRANKLWDLV
jgi:hypothetical protein